MSVQMNLIHNFFQMRAACAGTNRTMCSARSGRTLVTAPNCMQISWGKIAVRAAVLAIKKNDIFYCVIFVLKIFK